MPRKWNTKIKSILFIFGGLAMYMVVSAVLTPNWNYPEDPSNAGIELNEFRNLSDDVDVFFLEFQV